MEPEPAPVKPRLVKIKVFGPKNAGKKSVVFRYTQNKAKMEEVPTFGLDFMFKMINKEGKKYQMKVWRPKDDTETGSKEYLKSIKIVMYIVDITDKSQTDDLKTNIEKIFENAEKNSIKYILGNKLDLEEKRVLDKEEISALCEKCGYKYREISANTGMNVNIVFDEALNDFIKKFPLKEKKEEEKK